MNNTILKGITVLEISGLAPVQFCGQILSDFGARVIRIDKVGFTTPQEELLGNNKLSVAVNFKSPEGIDVFKKLSSKADVIVEPFRAGVMEKLGLGPELLMKNNERLVYARLSGFGQTGKYSQFAGHDINFLSLSGVLATLGWRNKSPDPPCNLIGDFAGGSLLCALGIMMALYEREKSGLGQIVDVSILRGAAYISSWIFGTKSVLFSEPRGNNLLDGGSYMYNVYETKDGKWMSVGGLEEKFYYNILKGLNLTKEECPYFSSNGHEIFTLKFKEKTQSEWIQIFKDLDACVTPMLTVEEAATERPEDYLETQGSSAIVAKPEPRFSRSKTVESPTYPSPFRGQHTFDILKEFGYKSDEIQNLSAKNAIYILEKPKL